MVNSLMVEADQSGHDWYFGAIFYELSVQAFQDSDSDGVGDFHGLLARLDYLEWLGVTCIWLMPFNQSPLRDGGYDISDFYQVQPEYGSVDDVRHLVEEAHKRGMRVVMDLPINHTSDQHPWFQAACSAPDNPYRDWYLWSTSNQRFAEARVIFVDSETSNWTWNDQAGAYFWHRFFKHQPDLNYDNPQVRQATIDICRFWLGTGMDGFRLDGLPYLFERTGTSCENLPEGHDFLAELRALIDKEFPGRVLLGEAQQNSEGAVNYFGSQAKPECQICFWFPLMPRLFLAIRQERRQAVSELLKQVQELPGGCQWGLFLRNHDEMSLEEMSGEERDFLWGEYAQDPRMKLNFGIRRRLAPMLDNNRRKIELFYGLLLSLPGSPVLYYGDEIGMGDNVYLGDRNGVRTPMQWSGDQNGGFSRADFAQLVLPPQMDPVYGFAACNVSSQRRNETSLLMWVRRLLGVRRRWAGFGEGKLTMLNPSNNAILAFLRVFGDEVVLCVNNLSGFAQPVELDLQAFKGFTPVEMLGRVHFPQIGELPYLLTLSPHGFYWFSLECEPKQLEAS